MFQSETVMSMYTDAKTVVKKVFGNSNFFEEKVGTKWWSSV